MAKDKKKKKKWIQESKAEMERKGTVGSLTRLAKKAGKSPMAFARAHKHSKGRLGKKARWAVNVHGG